MRSEKLLTGLLLVIVVIVLTAGCADASLPEEEVAATPSPTLGETSPPDTPTKASTPNKSGAAATPVGGSDSAPTPGEIDPGLTPLIDIARDDLAERLDITPEQISVIEGRLVEWPDASLGCPQPDMVYIQIPMDGAIILLQVDGEIYQYHTGGDMQVFLCENPAGGFQITPKPDEFVPPPDSEID